MTAVHARSHDPLFIPSYELSTVFLPGSYPLSALLTHTWIAGQDQDQAGGSRGDREFYARLAERARRHLYAIGEIDRAKPRINSSRARL